MNGIKIDVIGNVARVTERPARITAGTVGLPVTFTFDEQWDGLHKTAVFRSADIVKIVEELESEAIVPWELLERPNTYLSVGVYGTNSDGTVVIPTTWTKVLGICEAVNPDGDVGTDPTLPVWQRLLISVGNLLGLNTSNKSNLVEAVNEVYNIATAGGIESDPTLSQKGKAADAKATGDAIRNLTAKDVGAKPADWMPTPSDIGAMPDTWAPTAEDVGARPDTWMPTAEDVGARPNTWTPTTEDVGATPASHAEDKNNPHSVTADQVGARPDTWMPTAEEVGARPATWMPTRDDIDAQEQHEVTTFTLLANGWADNRQSVSVKGVTGDNTVIATPSPVSHYAYCEAGVFCRSQGNGGLTFMCDTHPEEALTVNVIILN